MLVAAGSNLQMRDINGQTPMMLAFQVDDHDLAAYLESKSYYFLYFVCRMNLIQIYFFIYLRSRENVAPRFFR